MAHMSNRNIEVKICGVTIPEQAREIARLGADYIGCIIEFPKSPRSVSRVRARELQDALKGSRATLVGVTVNIPIEKLIEIIKHVGLKIVQLHGDESVEYVKRLQGYDAEVWKVVTHALRHSETKISESSKKNKKNNDDDFWILNQVQDDGGEKLVDMIVVDAKNPLHGAGGSGKLSDWNFAKELADKGFNVVLSGGLTPENVRDGIKSVQPSIVDVSSGVEAAPGVKDIARVKDFIRNAKVV
jgi:phosphoribosylanthranilate isomerase